MKKPVFLRAIFFYLTLGATYCHGQINTTIPKDSLSEPKAVANAAPKVVKNYFKTQYPQTFWFVQCGLQDQAGNLWFGTNADGVYCYNGQSFTNYTRKDGLCNNDVLCMLEDKSGNIWFGTRGGLCRYTPSTSKAAKQKFSSFPMAGNDGVFADNFVWSIVQDKSGKIWLATNDGIYCCNPLNEDEHKTPVFTAFLDNDSIINKNRLQLKVVQKIIEDKNGNIWFASGSLDGEGICRYDGKLLINFTPDGLRSFRAMLECKNGDLLLLSKNEKLYRYDGKTFTDFTKAIGLQAERITAVLEDKKGNIWLSTDGNTSAENENNRGVWRYDGRSLKLFTSKEALGNNSVLSIVEDRAGNIWFGTSNTGLYRYDGERFTDFTE